MTLFGTIKKQKNMNNNDDRDKLTKDEVVCCKNSKPREKKCLAEKIIKEGEIGGFGW
jgi:hypothetical protein